MAKLEVAFGYPHFIAINQFEILPITGAHVLALSGLPMNHKDPFDRMLAAQAISEKMAIISADSALAQLGATVLWQ